MKKLIIALISIGFISVYFLLFAQVTEQIEKSAEDIQKEKVLRERIERPRVKPPAEEEKPAPKPAPAGPEVKTLVKKINISGVTFISQYGPRRIASKYENKELTLREMQQIADQITDNYRRKGYITSRAYLPPQKIQDGVLEIAVVEGVTGNIEVKGNRFFKTSLLRKKIPLEKGDPFNYEVLRKGMAKINEQTDRQARAVLVPGKEPGTTDVVLEIQDKLPIHVGFEYDNFGSRYVNKNRLKTTITHNNLLGWDDILSIQYQIARGENYRYLSAHYNLPIKDDLKMGFYAVRSDLHLRKDYEDLNSRGKSRLFGIYVVQTIIDKENIDLNVDLGFDYKDICNFQLDDMTSKDRLRVARAGFDFDMADMLGRTLITHEADFGIPDIMGGLKKNDWRASRSGSGGKFIKNTLNILRLQRLPFNTTLLWKNQLQFCPYILTAAEQFQIGGIANVRGYPPAEVVGDRGYAMTWEWSLPVYPISKKIKVPFSKTKLYDALRVVTFYDWANARLRRLQAGEEKNRTLRAAGCGLRFNLAEDFSLRVEWAWPLDNPPSDGRHLHT